MKKTISYGGGVSKVFDLAAGLVLAAALEGAEACAENSSAKYCFCFRLVAPCQKED